MTTPNGDRRGAAERVATYGVPVASVVIAALVVLGPGAPRASTGVRVVGRSVQGSTVLALRMISVRRLYGVDEIASGGRVRVEASEAGAALGAWEGDLGDDGIGEALVRLSRPATSAIDVRVLAGGVARAWGPIVPVAPEAPTRGARAVAGLASGEIAIEVSVARGVMTAPQADTVAIRALGGAKDVTVHVTAPGADLGTTFAGGDARLPADGVLRFAARPLAHDLELTIDASSDLGRRGRWEGHLPVVPGAMWLDPASAPGRVRVVTPAPRDRAYVSIIGADGDRLFGASIPLSREAGATAAIELPALPRAPHHAVLAGDPMEQGTGTVAWPIAGADEGAVIPRPVDVLIDGMPEVEAREGRRAGDARGSAMLLLGAAGLAEALLLARQSRLSRQRLEQHFAAAAEAAKADVAAGGPTIDLSRTTERGLGFALALYGALIVLAFAMVAALASFR